jgi:HEAT repeat protein
MDMTGIWVRAGALAFVCLLLAGNAPRGADSPREQAWAILQANWNENGVEKRAQAVRVLALLPGDARAFELMKKAAEDDKPEVLAAAATALGQLHTPTSVTLLHKLIDDSEPSVTLAAAAALTPRKDGLAYEAYYEFLTGERKTSDGMIKTQMKTLHDPKKLAQIGIEQGIGFIPYASIPFEAYKTLHVDDVSPVRAAAARVLAADPDPASGRALAAAVSDKSWLVKTAALEAIAKRGDPSLLQSVVPAMMDDNTSVRCTAAAAVIRLSGPATAPRKKQ